MDVLPTQRLVRYNHQALSRDYATLDVVNITHLLSLSRVKTKNLSKNKKKNIIKITFTKIAIYVV